MRCYGIAEVVEELKKVYPHGLQIARRIGILSFTREIYRYRRRYFVFDVNGEDQNFDLENGYTRAGLLKYYDDAWFQIEGPVYLSWVWVGDNYEPYPPLRKPYSPPS